ncbi:hypothetical protein C0580_00950 [Candidatus Parcubacteria bacterium]|nr:MAG: hypothetical protein C0580_00950 [Candidatus Parcubacteria bacterium]
MKFFKFLFPVIFLFLPLISLAAPDSCFFYFYSEECSLCQETATVLESLEAKYPNVQIHKYEVWHDQENKKMFNQFLNKHQISGGGVPVLFMTDKYYLGSQQIINNLENDITKGPSHACPTSVASNNQPSSQFGSIDNGWQKYNAQDSDTVLNKLDNIIVYIAIGILLLIVLWLGFKREKRN